MRLIIVHIFFYKNRDTHLNVIIKKNSANLIKSLIPDILIAVFFSVFEEFTKKGNSQYQLFFSLIF